MTFDVLNEPVDMAGWAEPAAEKGFAEHWDRELCGIEIPPWRRNVVTWIEQAYHTGDRHTIVVADIGCGAAVYARHLLAAGVPFEYHGYDHNAGVLEAACRRWMYMPHDRVHLHQMDARATRWPITSDSFDVLIWDTTLRFCEDVEAALDQSRRVCRGWILIARTPLEDRTWREAVRYYGMTRPSSNWHFDERFFLTYAQRHEWTFAPSVGDEEMHILSRAPLPREARIRPVRSMARVFHEAYVRQRVAQLFATVRGRWALYGGGGHTRWLLALLPAELHARIVCILDDAATPGSEIGGLPVLSPAALAGARVRPDFAGILVSSDTIEERLAAAATRLTAGIVPVHRLYEGLPPGPFDKSAVPATAASAAARYGSSAASLPTPGQASGVASMCRT